MTSSYLTLIFIHKSDPFSFPITAADNMSRLIVIFIFFNTFLCQGGGNTGTDDVY